MHGLQQQHRTQASRKQQQARRQPVRLGLPPSQSCSSSGKEPHSDGTVLTRLAFSKFKYCNKGKLVAQLPGSW